MGRKEGRKEGTDRSHFGSRWRALWLRLLDGTWRVIRNSLAPRRRRNRRARLFEYGCERPALAPGLSPPGVLGRLALCLLRAPLLVPAAQEKNRGRGDGGWPFCGRPAPGP